MSWSWKHAALVLGSFVLLWVCLQATGIVPMTAAQGFFEQSMGSPRAWKGTFQEMMPLLLAGLAVFIALRAGLFNIGAEGQIMVGALAAAATALAMKSTLGGFLAIFAGLVAGALWALPAGLIKALRGGHEVIATIMLNNIAALFCLWMVKGVLRDPSQQSATTAEIDKSSMLPDLINAGGFKLNWGIVIALILVFAIGYWLKKTVAGYELRAAGEAPKAAQFAGVNTKKTLIGSMLASGAISGLTGAILVLASEHRFYGDFTAGYGFDALGVALLAGSSTLALIPSALLFAVIAKGTTGLALMGVPKGMSSILLGIIIVVFASFRYRKVKNDG